jgi:hypothetical protein
LAHAYYDVSILTDPRFQPAGYNIYRDYFEALMKSVTELQPRLLSIKQSTLKPTRKIQELVSSVVEPLRSRFLARYLMLRFLSETHGFPQDRCAFTTSLSSSPSTHMCACIWAVICTRPSRSIELAAKVQLGKFDTDVIMPTSHAALLAALRNPASMFDQAGDGGESFWAAVCRCRASQHSRPERTGSDDRETRPTFATASRDREQAQTSVEDWQGSKSHTRQPRVAVALVSTTSPWLAA